MTKTKLNIASIQMVSCANFDKNLNCAETLIRRAALSGAQMVVLPEYFAFMGLNERAKFDLVEKPGKGVIQSMMSKLADELSLWIVAGSHPVESGELERPFGRCYVFDDKGQIASYYDKIHLFDVKIDDNKGVYSESKYTKSGEKLVAFNTPWGKVGLAICYDIRFPELFRLLSEKGCQLLVLPAAFTHNTGQLHWLTLIKARAIENLCYFVASAQGGIHENGRHTWGHSCIVSPWGKLLSQIEKGEGVISHTLDFSKLSQLRKEFPVLAHKKL